MSLSDTEIARINALRKLTQTVGAKKTGKLCP